MTIGLLGAAALLVGVIVGTVGIGGVLFAPALILIGQVEPHEATAISLISFTLTGIVSLALHLRSSDFPRTLTWTLAIGLLPGAFLGGWLSSRIPDEVILAALFSVSLFSAVWGITRGRPTNTVAVREDLDFTTAVPVGLGTGFGSAITGTSGPVLLTPALMAFGLPTLRAIVVGQVAQAVVTPAGAFGYLLHTRPDPTLTAVLGGATALGAAIGIYGARRLRLPDSFLRTLVTALLFTTSVLIAIRLVASL